jgi:hypothetical protein
MTIIAVKTVSSAPTIDLYRCVDCSHETSVRVNRPV